MLTRLALLFVIHILTLGVYCGRSGQFPRIRRLPWLWLYFLAFYIAVGLLFAFAPSLLNPEDV